MDGLTMKEAAAQLGVSAPTVSRLIKDHIIQATPIKKTRRGTHYRIPQSEIDRIKHIYVITPEEAGQAAAPTEGQPDTVTEQGQPDTVTEEEHTA